MYIEEITQINQTFQRRKQRFTQLGIFFFLMTAIIGYLLQSGLLFSINKDDKLVVQILTLVFLIFSIAFTLSSTSLSYKKIIMTYILPLIIRDLKLEHPSMTFEEKHRDRTFNETGGLFWRKDNVSIQYKITTNEFQMMRCTMSHSNGKSQTVDFDGIYYIFSYVYPNRVQIRTSGRPNIHGLKLTLLSSEKPKYYSGTENDRIDPNLNSIYRSIQRSYEAKKLYLSTTKKDLHIAIQGKSQQYPKIKKVTYDEVEQIKHWFDHQVQIGIEIASLLSIQT